MDIGLVVGLVFIAIIVVVRMSGILDDDIQEQRPVKSMIKRNVIVKPTIINQDVVDNCITSNISIPKKIRYYRTDKEFDRLLNTIDESTELEDVISIDEIIASYIFCVIEIEKVETFYEYERRINELNSNRDYLLRVINLDKRSQNGIKMFYKMFKGTYNKQDCSEEFCLSILNNIKSNINTFVILQKLICRFEMYWANVLLGYVRKHAYINRLEYLIDYTKELANKDYIKSNPQHLEEVSRLRTLYLTQLNTAKQ